MTASDPLPPGATVGSAGERALLRRLRARIPAAKGVLLGPGDDAAIVRTSAETVITTDSLVENVHFRREWAPARLVGRKALSVNLSDIGGMGGRGLYATVSLCLPPDLEVAWLDGLYDGLLERAAEAGTALVGGNLSAIGGPVVVDVALLGEAPRPLRRAGARPGDRVVVTGAPGSASIGLALLRAGTRPRQDGSAQVPPGAPAPDPAQQSALDACLRAQLDPAPPLGLAAAVGPLEGVHAGMDVSDGLSSDLLALCVESGVCAILDEARLPLPPASGLSPWGAGEALGHLLHGGEDYGLLLAVHPEATEEVLRIAGAYGVHAFDVGTFEAGAAGLWLAGPGPRRPVPAAAHQHFGGEPHA